MSNASIDSAKLVGQIEEYLNALSSLLDKCDLPPTAEIKRGIGKIGRDNGYLACATDFPRPKCQEWLYDLIWYRNTRDHHLEELIMVLESEWSRDLEEILYDFEKLLIAKAPIKVMIFQDHNDDLDTLWAMLAKGIRTFRSPDPGETYLLAAYREEIHSFVIKRGNHVEIFGV